MLKIKLNPHGKKHQRTYRIVIAEQRSKSNGKVVDTIGFYTPQTKTLEIDQDKLKSWQKNGAQVTLGIDKLLNPGKYPPKPKKRDLKPEPEPKKEEKIEQPKEEIKEVKEETPQS